MANSINTNYGAQIALQNLNATNKALETTQNRVNTGLKVATAKDNGAIFAIATTQRADMAAQDAVKNSLQRGQSIVDVALAAGDTIIAALEEMKSLAVSIQSSTGDTQAAYLKDFNAMGQEILDAMGGASFDGANLWTTASTGATEISVVKDTAGGKVVLGKATATNGEAAITTVASATPVAAAAATTANVQAAIDAVTGALSTFGTQSKSIGRQLTFVGKLQDALETGVGNLVDADLAKESARLTALQTKQQLGVQALSIANQSSSILLGLFR